MARPVHVLPSLALLALTFLSAFSYDPSPLQDICVAVKEPKDALFVNGKFCKNPILVTPNDFFFQGLQIPRNVENAVGSNVTQVTVDQFPGLNTLGISLARIDYAVGGLEPPHTHPRGTEILQVLEGTLYVGFVTSNPDNRFFAKVLNVGDVFVFPIGLIHFQLNIGKTNAVAFSSLGSQNPGVIIIANALFNSTPPINPEVLAKGFMVDEKFVIEIQLDMALESLVP